MMPRKIAYPVGSKLRNVISAGIVDSSSDPELSTCVKGLANVERRQCSVHAVHGSGDC